MLKKQKVYKLKHTFREDIRCRLIKFIYLTLVLKKYNKSDQKNIMAGR